MTLREHALVELCRVIAGPAVVAAHHVPEPVQLHLGRFASPLILDLTIKTCDGMIDDAHLLVRRVLRVGGGSLCCLPPRRSIIPHHLLGFQLVL